MLNIPTLIVITPPTKIISKTTTEYHLLSGGMPRTASPIIARLYKTALIVLKLVERKPVGELSDFSDRG